MADATREDPASGEVGGEPAVESPIEPPVEPPVEPSVEPPVEPSGEPPDEAPDPPPAEAAEDLSRLAAGLEALLFAHGAPVTAERLAEALEAEPAAVRRGLEALEARSGAPGSGLRLARVAGGFQLTTREEWSGAVERLLAPSREEGLSEAALEALSVIAYRQPITVPELNELRGVNSQSVVGTLVRRRLVRSRGRKKVVGRPLLYGTTRDFLERFGLDRLEDLPKLRELEEPGAG